MFSKIILLHASATPTTFPDDLSAGLKKFFKIYLLIYLILAYSIPC